jgi:hypothetical protein
MIFAIFMVLVLLTLGASWHGEALLLVPIFVVTVAAVLAYLIYDMTTPLTLTF